jgi:hypothetical protein
LTEKLSKLLRVLIPSWRFFDELGEVSRLYYRFGTEPSKLGPWILYAKKSRRTAWCLFFNPEENLYHANIRLIAELPETEALVESIVRGEIHETQPVPSFFQFRVGEFTSETLLS